MAARSTGGKAPWVVLLIGVALTFLAWHSTVSYLEREALHDFEAESTEALHQVERRIQGNVDLLRGVSGLHESEQGFSRREFAAYVASQGLPERHPETRAMLYVRPLPGDRYVVDFLEPHAGNEALAGANLGDDPARRVAFERARDTGEPMALDLDGRRGFILVLPVYRPGKALPGVIARREAFAGLAGLEIEIGELLRASLSSRALQRMNVTVRNVNAPAQAARELPLRIGEREWRVGFTPRPEAADHLHGALPGIVLLLGFIVSGLLAWLVRNVVLTRDQALALAQEMTNSYRDSENRLELALAGADLGMWDWDLRSGRLVRNERWAHLFGFRPEEITPDFAAWERMVHPDDRSMVQARLDDHLAGHAELYEAEYRLKSQSGEWIWVLDRGRIVERDAEGGPARISGTILDVTERRRRVEQLRASEERLGLALEGSRLSLWDFNGETGEVYLSEGWSALLGGPARATYSSVAELLDVVHPDDRGKVHEMMSEVLKGRYAAYEIEHRVRARSGQWKWILSRGRVVSRGEEGRALRLLGTNMDITERKMAEEQVQHMAYHDSLTGLPNRLLLEDRVRRDVALAQRAGGRVAVLFLDLDHFKHINDSEGHDVGDRVLCDVALRIAGCLREGDTVARLGGDEFAICLPSFEHARDADVVARKILEVLSEPVVDMGHEVRTDASIGISLYPEDGHDAVTLLRNADNAMYHAKERGRAQFQYFREEMNQRVQHRLTVERGLRQALERGEFVMHYQPQVEIASGRVVGVEALVRWDNPERGLVAPSEFIAIAEETGQIVALGQWALREACAQGVRWDRLGIGPIRIGVNLSVRQFREKDLAERVRATLSETGFSATRLELEITESMLLQHGEETVGMLESLAFSVGARLTIDDFGTGYSGLGYLRRLPIHGLKIDQSFVRELEHNSEDQAIVAGVIEIARGLGLGVTAEGVETEGQLASLKRLGCAFAQGHFIGPAMSAADVEPLLRPGEVPEVFARGFRETRSKLRGS